MIFRIIFSLLLYLHLTTSNNSKHSSHVKKHNPNHNKRQYEDYNSLGVENDANNGGENYNFQTVGDDAGSEASMLMPINAEEAPIYKTHNYEVDGSLNIGTLKEVLTDEDDENNGEMMTLSDIDDASPFQSQKQMTSSSIQHMMEMGGTENVNPLMKNMMEAINIQSSSKNQQMMSPSNMESFTPKSVQKQFNPSLVSQRLRQQNMMNAHIPSISSSFGHKIHKKPQRGGNNMGVNTDSLPIILSSEKGSPNDYLLKPKRPTETVISIQVPLICHKCPDCPECPPTKSSHNLVEECCPNTVLLINKDSCPICSSYDLTNCEAFSRDVEEKSGVNFLVQMGVIEPWDESMSTPSSQKFQDIRKKIQDFILKIYVDHLTYQDTIIIAIRNMKGIAVVESLIRFSKEGKGDMQKLHKAIMCGCGCEIVDSSIFTINPVNSSDLVDKCPPACLQPDACEIGMMEKEGCDKSCCIGHVFSALPVQTASFIPAIQPILPTFASPDNGYGCGVGCSSFCMPLCTPECCSVNLNNYRRNLIKKSKDVAHTSKKFSIEKDTE